MKSQVWSWYFIGRCDIAYRQDDEVAHFFAFCVSVMAKQLVPLALSMEKSTHKDHYISVISKYSDHALYSRNVMFIVSLQYPVIAVDAYLPINNPLSGKDQGELRVLLALGTQQQVMSLDTLKVIATATQIDEQNQQQIAQAGQIRPPQQQQFM